MIGPPEGIVWLQMMRLKLFEETIDMTETVLSHCYRVLCQVELKKNLSSHYVLSGEDLGVCSYHMCDLSFLLKSENRYEGYYSSV